MDNFPSKGVPDLVTRSGSTNITAADGDDVFRVNNTATVINTNGSSTTTPTPLL